MKKYDEEIREIQLIDEKLDIQFLIEDAGWISSEIPVYYDDEPEMSYVDRMIWGKKEDIARIYRAMYKAREKGRAFMYWGGAFNSFSCPEFNEYRKYYGIYFDARNGNVFIIDDEDIFRMRDVLWAI